MRVLVFDDDVAMGDLVVRVAGMLGMEAAAVTDAVAFAEQLRSDPPEVVVLDLQLRDTDGVQQMRLLADRQYAGALVLMSGYNTRVLASAHAVGQGLGLRVEHMLDKPLRITELEHVLERLQFAGRSVSAGRLLEAIANDELALDFLPIVAREPKELKRLEALVRWDHPVAGRIPPAEFLPVAEGDVATNDALADWVIGAVVEAYQVLTELGISVPLAMNLSTRNLRDLTLPDRLEQRLRAGGMPLSQLCLEITDSAMTEGAPGVTEVLSRLRLKGVWLSVDNFGAGYSTLKLLRQMPFTEIKIDRSFVGDATASPDSQAIVKSIIDLATSMKLGCIAEGVETAETADLLEKLGIRDMQGYLIAEPMPVEAVAAWLEDWTRSSPGVAHDRRIGPVNDATNDPVAKPGHREAPQSPAAVLPAGAITKVVRLPPRQLEVMRLLSDSCSVKEIAHRLNLGIGTVKVHIALAYSALGAHNRTEAIKRAGPVLLGQ